MEKRRLLELAGMPVNEADGRLDDSDAGDVVENLLIELMVQFQNAKAFFPKDTAELKREIKKNADAYVGICNDISRTIAQLKRKGAV